MQKFQFLPSVHSSNTVSFRVPSRNWPLPFLTMLTPNFQSSFNLCEFMPTCKKSVNSINSFWRYSHFRLHRPDWSHPLFTMPNQKMFDQLLIFVNLYQHAKNYTVSSICVGEMVDFNPGIWLAETILAYISGTRFFPNIWFVKERSN